MSEVDEETVTGADYAVGFRHPPLHTRFKPGVSGNPSGRPKDSKNFKTFLHSILNEQISLQGGSQSRKISKAEAITRRIFTVSCGRCRTRKSMGSMHRVTAGATIVTTVRPCASEAVGEPKCDGAHQEAWLTLPSRWRDAPQA
jgi:hypothetical protein